MAGIVALCALLAGADLARAAASVPALKIGGDTRLRWEWARHPAFSVGPNDDDGCWSVRARFRGEGELGQLHGTLEIGAAAVAGRRAGARVGDVDRGDILRAEVEWVGETAGLRIGRQDLAFGASRVIGVRDGPNIRANFDGARAWWRVGDWRIDAVAARPVRPRSDVFDNGNDPARHLVAVYAAAPAGWLPAGRLDLYVIDYRNRHARYARGGGPERREMFGLRFWGKRGAWGWDCEAGIQRGRFAGGPLTAWAVAMEGTRYWDASPTRPYVALRLNALSGDRGGLTLGTFNALFPGPRFYAESKLIGPANLLDTVLAIGVRPTDRLLLEWTGGWFSRMSVRDGVYGYGGGLLLAPGLSAAHGIGPQLSARLEWKAAANCTVALAGTHVGAGPFLRDVGAPRILTLTATTTIRF